MRLLKSPSPLWSQYGAGFWRRHVAGVRAGAWRARQRHLTQAGKVIPELHPARLTLRVPGVARVVHGVLKALRASRSTNAPILVTRSRAYRAAWGKL